MSDGRKTGQARGRLRLVAGQGDDQSPRQGNLHAVGTGPALAEEPPALPGKAADGIHVLSVSLRGAASPVWRRLEVPSAITLDRLHHVLQEAFAWSDTGPHWFQTAHGDFDGEPRPDIRPEDRGDDTIALARVGGTRDWIGYRCGYHDERQADIVVEETRPATPGVSYPRCTRTSATRQV
ncbi:MAG: plasmid pRiA4b ORF-3 family protein [Trebonia sp.]